MKTSATTSGLDAGACERAYRSGDARFDGRFFIGVKTTGIYCRPVCPVKPPKPENTTFYPSAAAAAEAGLRPCLRCRPEVSAGTPDWSGAPATVSRALRLISEGVSEEGGVNALAARLGLTPRHLHRLFVEHLGASPLTVIRTRRLHLAKRLIDGTDLALADVAFAAGFGSVRRFNATFQDLYGRTPGELRRARGGGRKVVHGDGFVFRLPYRPPLDWARMLGYFQGRATPGVEELRDGRYRRGFRLDGEVGLLTVGPLPGEDALELRVDGTDAGTLLKVVEKVRRVFDLGADPEPIAAHLARDQALRPWLRRLSGLRVPGAWDGFEITVRAIVGQQVSVKGASTITGRIAERCGEPVDDPEGGLTRLSPTPEAIIDANLERIGMPGSRVATVQRVAEAVHAGDLIFDCARPERLHQSLLAIRGVGEWTAQYVALRLGEPDAFPATDLGLLKSAAVGGRSTPKELLERAERWRPWRAYAALTLWNANGD